MSESVAVTQRAQPSPSSAALMQSAVDNDDDVSPSSASTSSQLHRRNSSRVRQASTSHDWPAAMQGGIGAVSTSVMPKSPNRSTNFQPGDIASARLLPTAPYSRQPTPTSPNVNARPRLTLQVPSTQDASQNTTSLALSAANLLRRASTRVMGRQESVSPVGRIDELQRVDTVDIDSDDEDDSHLHHSGRHAVDEPPRATPPSDASLVRSESIKQVQGNSLGIFSPASAVRRLCLRVLRYPWTEAFVLLLIVLMVVCLIVQAAPNIYDHPRPERGYFHGWVDVVLFVIFSLFTVEVCMRVIALGLLFGPRSSHRLYDKKPPRPKDFRRIESQDDLSQYPPAAHPAVDQATRSVGAFVFVAHRQNVDTEKPFLRKSWNRIDLVAVVAYWISFALAMTGLEAKHDLYFFRAISVLRVVRLLAITEGTETILHSLKLASPHLIDVGTFVIFAMLLFSIIGTQSFSSSARRSCQWRDPAGILPNVTFESQQCGSYFDAGSGQILGYISSSTGENALSAKGYTCPANSFCVEGENPNNGVTSFDNIGASLLQVVIVASANTWTDVMYSMINAEYMAASAFFIVALVVLQYWLINLFVAVITTTFGSIVDETKHSALAAKKLDAPSQAIPGVSTQQITKTITSFFELIVDKTYPLWSLLVLVDLAFQASQYYGMSESRAQLLSSVELAFTIAFDVEIVVRGLATAPDWRRFLASPRNISDLIIAVGATIAQIPPVKESAVGPWLTVFQVARFYRVILAIPPMRKLILRVFGTLSGLTNVVFFNLLMTFTVSLIAVQFLRGVPDPDESTALDFSNMWIAFLSTYQILSSENWTDPLYNVLSKTGQFQTVLAAIFLCGWMLCAFFILINLLIAVISESLVLSEAEKARRQVEAYLASDHRPAFPGWHRRFSVHLDDHQRKESSYDGLPSHLQAVVAEVAPSTPMSQRMPRLGIRNKLNVFWRALARLVPRKKPTQTRDEEPERPPRIFSDKSLFVFGPDNKLRRGCQRIVEPSYGSLRPNGVRQNKKLNFAFRGLILLCIVASVAVTAVASPLYRQEYYLRHGSSTFTWYNLAEIFIVEAAIKIVADGFLFSSTAYLMSVWNILDALVLCTIITNMITILVGYGASSVFVRSLKAFRALRLINLSTRIRHTFYDVFIAGIGVLFSAACLCLLIIIPFAVWGQQIFGSGLFFKCNDSSVTTKFECAGEFVGAAVSDWTFPQPRVWTNFDLPSFDNFGSALLLLFELLSLEGWIDAMIAAISINGQDQQPQSGAATYYAIFFVLYNIFGFIILAVFITLLIDHATKRSGSALLTNDQRNWIDLKKMIGRQRPAKRPRLRPSSAFRAWCFDRATQKNGWWPRMMTALLCIHGILLLTIATTNSEGLNVGRNFAFLALCTLFATDVAVKLFGLGWRSFRINYWHWYDLVVVPGAAVTTLAVIGGQDSVASTQLQKLFLTAIAFKLIQRHDGLNHLFKLSAASLPALVNLFALWIILFFVWALLYMEVLGLTRIGPNGSWTINYSSFGKALLTLVLQSTGEGWNAIMTDYYDFKFPACTESPLYLFSDCSSSVGAYLLFISWNVLSMYLLANLILTAVVENFSAVFTSGQGRFALDREQMRSFKRAWTDFDRTSSGYIVASDIAPFLSRLRGLLDTRIWSERFSIRNLRDAARDSEYGTVDVKRLCAILSAVDVEELRERKRRKNHLHHEALLKAHDDPEGRISFRDMLLLVSQYYLVDDDKALSVAELVERKAFQAKLRERVCEDKVLSTIRTYILRKRFIKMISDVDNLRPSTTFGSTIGSATS